MKSRINNNIRMIDDLGQIAIPKEIRRMAEIVEGDEFLIYFSPYDPEVIMITKIKDGDEN